MECIGENTGKQLLVRPEEIDYNHKESKIGRE
jgi:hypothetical protein